MPVRGWDLWRIQVDRQWPTHGVCSVLLLSCFYHFNRPAGHPQEYWQQTWWEEQFSNPAPSIDDYNLWTQDGEAVPEDQDIPPQYGQYAASEADQDDRAEEDAEVPPEEDPAIPGENEPEAVEGDQSSLAEANDAGMFVPRFHFFTFSFHSWVLVAKWSIARE